MLVEALIITFCGSFVEGTFNIMDDIMEDRTKLAIKNYKATMKVKYHLRAEAATSTTMHVSLQM